MADLFAVMPWIRKTISQCKINSREIRMMERASCYYSDLPLIAISIFSHSKWAFGRPKCWQLTDSISGHFTLGLTFHFTKFIILSYRSWNWHYSGVPSQPKQVQISTQVLTANTKMSLLPLNHQILVMMSNDSIHRHLDVIRLILVCVWNMYCPQYTTSIEHFCQFIWYK